jgi:serine/threonine-protein kinase
MSPEQIKSAKDVDARADLWSAAVMFYEMLTGRVAFPAPTEYARLAAVLSTVPPPIESVDPQLGVLSAFMVKGLEKDRERRYQSALEMSRALTAATAGTEAAIASRVEVLPLSRLPDVPSLFQPSGALGAQAQQSVGVPTAVAPQQQGAPDTMNRIPTGKTPGGTLASPSTASGHSEPPPQIIVVAGGQAAGETLPSKDLPMLPARVGSSPPPRSGVAPGVVVALVLGALVAGALIGFAIARMM